MCMAVLPSSKPWSFHGQSYIFIPLRIEVDFQNNQARQCEDNVVKEDHSDL